MENKIIKISFISFITVCCCLFACDKLDMRGMFISYESVNSRFDQSMEWNALHPYREVIVPDDDYTLFVMGDSHVGGTDNLDTFFANALSSGAAAIVMDGDLTTGNEKDYDMFMQHLPGPDSAELFPIVGNHDLYFNGWSKYHSLFGSSTYYFTVKTPAGTDLYICLDSGSGTLGSKQAGWLREVLGKERSGHRRCVVFTHVNLFRFRHTASTSPTVEELHMLLDLFARHRVDMVVTGHDHKKSTGQFGNTTHIIMDALLDGFSDAGYLTLRINGGELTHRFVNL